jgi:hypothetical protein
MYTRLDDVPVYEYRSVHLDAHYYNDVQVALKRLGETIRFPIPKLKHLDLILEKDAWIIVDRAFNDVPVAAWTDFQVQHRSSLHEPIDCKIRLFHANANLILEQTLEVMMDLLREQLLSDDQD